MVSIYSHQETVRRRLKKYKIDPNLNSLWEIRKHWINTWVFLVLASFRDPEDDSMPFFCSLMKTYLKILLSMSHESHLLQLSDQN